MAGPHQETLFENKVYKLFPDSLQTLYWKQFPSCFETMFPVQTSVVVRMPVSKEVAAEAYVFYLALL